MTAQNCVIVIPIHSADPSDAELVAFVQCFTVLAAYSIVVLIPERLDCSKYRSVHADFETKAVNGVWLSSLQQYNKLKVSSYFYQIFSQYKYLLTYELDAFVFKDSLRYWCEQPIDYIGAAWFEGYTQPISDTIIGVGNSGFSLRNVASCRRILKRINVIKKIRSFWFKSKFQALVRFSYILNLFKKQLHINSLAHLDRVLFDHDVNEDIFWASFVPKAFTDFTIADIEHARKFSFDVNPSLLYILNQEQLPFGCHGWLKNDPEFWSRFIPRHL